MAEVASGQVSECCKVAQPKLRLNHPDKLSRCFMLKVGEGRETFSDSFSFTDLCLTGSSWAKNDKTVWERSSNPVHCLVSTPHTCELPQSGGGKLWSSQPAVRFRWSKLTNSFCCMFNSNVNSKILNTTTVMHGEHTGTWWSSAL